jgi:hypothetical protein
MMVAENTRVAVGIHRRRPRNRSRLRLEEMIMCATEDGKHQFIKLFE